MVKFADDINMPSALVFAGTAFVDDGSHNDAEAGDGIYTSVAEFGHSEKVPYKAESVARSVTSVMIVDQDFMHVEELSALASNYSPPLETLGDGDVQRSPEIFKVIVKCNIAFGTCGCIADRLGICSCCCFTIYNCSTIEFGLEW